MWEIEGCKGTGFWQSHAAVCHVCICRGRGLQSQMQGHVEGCGMSKDVRTRIYGSHMLPHALYACVEAEDCTARCKAMWRDLGCLGV